MHINPYKNTISIFKQDNSNTQNKNKNKNLKIGLTLCALAAPALPLLDGDSFKETYKNRNTAKFITGMIGVGGILALSQLLTTNSEDKKTRLYTKAATGAIAAPLVLLVDKWAQQEKKAINKKWYILSAIAGAGVMCISEKIRNK